jgi:hypothetical protein
MAIDPVVLLTEELRSIELALSKATQIYNRSGLRQDGEVVNMLLIRTKRLFDELFETVPSSALGAAEIIGIAAQRLPFSHARYAAHLHTIADRLSMGQRNHCDLVWLRAMQAALMEGLCGKDGGRIACMLSLAIQGASRPVMVFRSVKPSPRPTAWQDILSARPN